MANLLLTIKNPRRDIYWRKLVSNDFEEVKDIMLNHYVKWEPPNATMGLTVENGGLDQFNIYWASKNNEKSICAYDPSKNNKIVAIRMVSGPYCPNIKASNWGEGRKLPVRLAQMHRLSECLSFGPNNVVESYAGEHKYMKGLGISVNDEYFKLGLGGALIRKSLELAKEAGCKYFFAELTSAYTAKIFDKAGAKVIKKIQYSEYMDSVSGEKIMANCKPPHCSATTVVVEL